MQSNIFLVVTVATLLSINVIAQSPATGMIIDHGYVDLGLSVKWATCNIGAKSSSDYGNYFAWGDAETKSKYSFVNSEIYLKQDISLFLDAATEKWGSPWRMPTWEECLELLTECDWELTTVRGHKGYKVTSRTNGNSIFLPFAGYRSDKSLKDAGEGGNYWTSTAWSTSVAKCLNLLDKSFISGTETWTLGDGLTVRPVTE